MNAGAIINYSLNKLMPFLIIGFLIFIKFGFNTWEPYVVLGLCFFIAKFSHDVGFAVGFCEKNNIPYREGDGL